MNEHFGRATRFLIYDLNDQLLWVEDRSVDPLSVGDPAHPFDAERFEGIAARLEDCSKVYVTQIGDTPAARLRSMGIEPQVYHGAIADIKA